MPAIDDDWRRVLADVDEALATGRAPEDVQAERHTREREAADRQTRTEEVSMRTRWLLVAAFWLVALAAVCFVDWLHR